MSPVPAFGHKTFMQLGGKETTYGVFNAPAGTYKFRFDVLSWNLTPQIGIVRDKSFWGNMSRRANYQGPIFYKGTISLKCNYEGYKEIFRAAFGTYASSGAALPSPAIDDTFKEGLTLNSYSVEIGYGGINSNVFRVLGLKILGLTLKGTAATGDDGMLTLDLNVIARDIDTNAGAGYTATGSINFPTQMPVFFGQAVFVDDGTADFQQNLRVTQFEATFEGAHVEDRLYLSSILIDDPVRDDAVVGRMKLTQEFNSMSQWLAARNFTAGSPKLIFQNPTTINSLPIPAVCNVSGANATTITRGAGSFTTDGVKAGHYIDTANGVFPPGTYVVTPGATTCTVANNSNGALAALVNGTITFTTARELEIRMNNANLTDLPIPIDKWGRLISTATWEGIYDSTDAAAMVLRVRGSEVVLP